MSDKFVNIVSIIAAVISFLMMIYAVIMNLRGVIHESMILFYGASALAILAVFLILLKRNDW